jgi:inositol-1,4,5-trisphosphate 5-phosphatase
MSVDKEQMKIFVMTFNTNSAKVTSGDFSFLPPGFDLYVLGFQEVGPFIPIACTKFQKALTDALHGHFGSSFKVVCDQVLLAIKLFIVASDTVFPKISIRFTHSIATGHDGTYGNKGACVCSLKYGETTSFLFVTAHFEAHDDNLQLRNENYAVILKAIQRCCKCDPLSCHNYCFFTGDLNYRIDSTYAVVKKLAHAARYAELLEYDQLSSEKRAMRVFSGFFEGEIEFPPTYRFNKNSMTYDTTKKMRVPSFTDRILVYSSNRRNIELSNYATNMDLLISDHRPVFAHAVVKLRTDGEIRPRYTNPKSAVCDVA